MIRLPLGSACLALVACAEPPPRHEFTELHMGMAVTIVLHAAAESTARTAARAAFDRIAELEDVFSDYRAGSEVRQLARRAEAEPGAWIPISSDLLRVLDVALEVARASDGAFDPTLRPLVTLWRQARETGRPPVRAALDSARARVGWQFLELDEAASAVRLSRPGMQFDLGGVAKGYILGQALAVLERLGAPRAMIQAGGDIVLGQAPPSRAGWEIGIGDGVSEALSEMAVATSGTGEQFVEIDGVRYAHLLDPNTGFGLTVTRQVTVIGPDPAIADALATAMVVRGPSAVDELLSRYPGYRVVGTL
jgi:thiamine biosynthesis lipoprotein